MSIKIPVPALITTPILIITMVTCNLTAANATPVREPEPQTQSIPTEEIQTYKTESSIEAPTLTVSTYSATSAEELAAIRKAAEEARLKKEAEERAKAEAERKAAEAAEAAANAQRQASYQFSGQRTQPANTPAPGQIVPANGIISAAQQWVGVVPYGKGNHPSDSFSCDGYVQYVYAQNGISLPRGVQSQTAAGVQIGFNEAKAGDLIVWPGQHVAIYDGQGGYYHSPNWGRKVEHSNSINWGNPIVIRIR